MQLRNIWFGLFCLPNPTKPCRCSPIATTTLTLPLWWNTKIIYSLCPIHFFTLSFLRCSSQFFTFQNSLKMINFYSLNTNPSHYFHPPSPTFQLNINRSHHFTHFSYSLTLLYIFFLISVPSKELCWTEGVINLDNNVNNLTIKLK